MSKYKLIVEFFQTIDGEEISHWVKFPSAYGSLQEVVDASVDFMSIYAKDAHDIKFSIEVLD